MCPLVGAPCTVPAVITITGHLQKEAWDRNVLPPVEQVRPGLWSVPVPIPNNPLRYVLVYVLELDDGVALVDAGWNTDDAWRALNDGLAEAGGSMGDVKAVVVDPHPPRPLRSRRTRAGGLGRLGRRCTRRMRRSSRVATSKPTTSSIG